MTQKIEWGAGTPGPWIIDPQYLSEVQTERQQTVSSCWYGQAEGAEIRLNGLIDCSLKESAANARAIAEVPAMVHQLRAVRAAVGMLGGLGPLQYAEAIDTIQKTTDAILARIDGEG